MADTNFDVLIIGSGPGGYVTAIRAAQLGFKTAIVERDYLGGICLNWGCIPTKALLRSAEIFHYMQHAKDYGLKADNVGYDAKAVVQRSRAVSKRLNDGVGFLMKKNKVDVIWGEATIDAPQASFKTAEAAIKLSLDQEVKVTHQINALVELARSENDYITINFLQWFLTEQLEEVSSMDNLLKIVQRGADNLLQVEEYLARVGLKPMTGPAKE